MTDISKYKPNPALVNLLADRKESGRAIQVNTENVDKLLLYYYAGHIIGWTELTESIFKKLCELDLPQDNIDEWQAIIDAMDIQVKTKAKYNLSEDEILFKKMFPNIAEKFRRNGIRHIDIDSREPYPGLDPESNEFQTVEYYTLTISKQDIDVDKDAYLDIAIIKPTKEAAVMRPRGYALTHPYRLNMGEYKDLQEAEKAIQVWLEEFYLKGRKLF